MAVSNKFGIGRIKSRGSVAAGFAHWKMQRVTAVANVFLVVWFIFSAVSLTGADYAEVRTWLAAPFATTMMILLVVSSFWHARLGLQVVIEDYVHTEGLKIGVLTALDLLATALTVACLVAILKVSVGS